MTTSLFSLDAATSVIQVAGQEALRLVPGGIQSLNGAQLAGHRRRNLNGGCDIAQAGTSFAAPANGSWTLDGFRWGMVSGAAVTVSQQADAPPDNEFQSSIRVAVTTASVAPTAGQFAFVGTVIEGYDVRDLIGKPITTSFWVRSAKTGIHCMSLRNFGNDRSYVSEYTVNAANTWEKKSITVPAGLITAGTWNWVNGTGLYADFLMACGSTFQTAAGAWQTGNFLATANQVNCLDTVGNIFAITGLQVEPGLIATPYEHLKFADDLAHAMRYFQVVADSYGSGMMLSATELVIHMQLPVAMRVAPSLSVTFNGSGLQFLANGAALATAQVQPGLLGTTPTTLHLDFQGTASGVANSGAILRSAVGGQKMSISARLP